MGKKVEKKEPAKVDQVFVLGLDANGKPRGARFAELKDSNASAAMDMNCRVLISQPEAVSTLAMKLPVGRVYGTGKAVKLFVPNIRRELYDKILEAAQAAAEQSDADIGIFEAVAGCPDQFVAGEKLVEPFGGVDGIGAAGPIRRISIRRHARQARIMRGQIAKRDDFAIASRDARSGRQQFRHRLVHPDLAAFGHVGQQQRSEQLGDRADLEQGVFVHLARAADAAAAMGDDSMAAGIGDADYHADAQAALVNALDEEPANRMLG